MMSSPPPKSEILGLYRSMQSRYVGGSWEDFAGTRMRGRALVIGARAGEWGMEWLMRQHREFTEHQRPAGGWGGDRVALYDDDSAIWRIAMDSDADALRVSKLLTKIMDKIGPGSVVKLRGREVHVITGPLVEHSEGVSETLSSLPHAEFEPDIAPPAGSICNE